MKSYPYSALQLGIDYKTRNKLLKIQGMLVSSNLTYRNEPPNDHFHITILKYENDFKITRSIKKKIKEYPRFNIFLKEFKIYTNEHIKYDLLLLDTQCNHLYGLHEYAKQFINHDEKFAYNPHLTIAKLPKNSNFDITQLKSLNGKKFRTNRIYISDQFGNKKYFYLTKN